MIKKFYAVLALVAVAGVLSPAYAQEVAATGAVAPGVTQWAVVTAGFALAIAAAFGAMAARDREPARMLAEHRIELRDRPPADDRDACG